MTVLSIVASGTRGDVQPYIALGKGLQQAGYTVRILTSDGFETLVTEAGLAFCSTGTSVEAILQSDEWRKTLDSGNFLAITRRMQSEAKRQAADIAQRLPRAVAGSERMVLGVGGLAGALPIAQSLGIPIIQAYVFPFTPTVAFPSPLVPNLPFGIVFNRLSFHVMRQLLWQSSRAGDVAVRQALGLAKGPFWGPFGTLARAHTPVVYGYSPHILPRPHDWPAEQHVTGPWFLDAPDDWTPPTDLVAFLDAGTPPVYIGFGSMMSRDVKAVGRMAVEALARAGQRGILAAGWGGLQAADLPPTIHTVSSIPHSWLFPRMAAVVHHGGAGTTAAGVRAGVPGIVVPFMGDQRFWGQRLAALGVGTSPLGRAKLSVGQLADAITETITNTAMRQRAADLGARVRAEDGVGTAVALIRQFFG